MPKTPDEIKKGLEITSNDCLMCACCITDCPYDLKCHPGNEETNTNVPKAMLRDALALIQQLENDVSFYNNIVALNNKTIDEQTVYIDQLINRVHQLEAERDAAVETIYEMAKCITEDVCEWCDGVECERLCMMHTIVRPGFKWRGVQKEE